jgi:hypothetical protein
MTPVDIWLPWCADEIITLREYNWGQVSMYAYPDCVIDPHNCTRRQCQLRNFGTPQEIPLPVRSVDSSMRELGHTQLMILKLDTEVCEYSIYMHALILLVAVKWLQLSIHQLVLYAVPIFCHLPLSCALSTIYSIIKTPLCIGFQVSHVGISHFKWCLSLHGSTFTRMASFWFWLAVRSWCLTSFKCTGTIVATRMRPPSIVLDPFTRWLPSKDKLYVDMNVMLRYNLAAFQRENGVS